MNIGKGILCAAAVAGLFATTSATSAPRSEGMNACIQAFVTQTLPQGHPVKVVKREQRDLYWRHYTAKQIEVKAKGKRTGQSYGSATCFVDRDGGLLAMQVEAPRVRVARSEAIERSTGG